MNAPKVTVVITTYNRPKMLSKAISSVLNQTLQDIEIIVVDDVSTEDNAAVIDSFGDKRITLIRNETHLGGAIGRNVGAAAGQSGEWIAFLDDDDLFLPDKLERQVALGVTLDDDYAVIDSESIQVGDRIVASDLKKAPLGESLEQDRIEEVFAPE